MTASQPRRRQERRRSRPWSLASATAVLAMASMGRAAAQEFCVVCVEPAATYRCQIENNGPAQTQPLKIACISALAKDGKHASCTVKGGTVLDCVGPLKKVDVLGKPPAQGVAAVPGEPYVVAPPKKPEPDPNEPPRTVEEALRRAAKSTGDSASQTGEALSSGAKKTWNCLTSFFKSC